MLYRGRKIFEIKVQKIFVFFLQKEAINIILTLRLRFEIKFIVPTSNRQHLYTHSF